jgi:endo-1,3(4)-beta-glucanase
MPYATNSWFENFMLYTGNNTISTFPVLMSALPNGFDITWSMSSRVVASTSTVIEPFIADWTLTANEGLTNHVITDYDSLTVTQTYTTAGAGNVVFPIAIGMPFFTSVWTGLTPVLSTINAILTVEDDNGGNYSPGQTTNSSTKFVIFMNSNSYWAIYTSTPIQLAITVGAVQFTSPFTGTLQILCTETTDTSSQFDQYAMSYPTSGTVDYEFNANNTVNIIYNYESQGNNLLMLAMIHHQQTLLNPLLTSLSFYSMKGTVVGVQGNQWVMQDNLVQITWDAPTPIDPTKISAITAALANDYTFNPENYTDPYFFGVVVARLGRLALIADQLNETTTAAYVRNTMMTFMEQWLSGTNADYLEYDTTYGGLCSVDGLANPSADYGQGYYNDHHFHYGYHLYALAVIGKENPSFIQQWEPEILDYVRDIANPSLEDPCFPVTRHKDWFSWHSWAAGLFEFGDNRDQESSSEAINSYYGVYLIGLALGNQDIQNFGNLLLTMELRAVKNYYHIPSNSTVYPSVFMPNCMVGVLWCTKVDYATFFGASPLYIHGIQMLPFTPVTELSLDAYFVQQEYPVMAANAGFDITWDPYVVADQAIIDPVGAWAAAQNLTQFHVGTDLTNTLWWISTRPTPSVAY